MTERRRRGRPPADDRDWAVLSGAWLLARAAFIRREGRQPTMAEGAGEMGVSERTLARVRDWQWKRRVRGMRGLGLPDPIPGVDLKVLRRFAQSPDDAEEELVRELFLRSLITTGEAAERLEVDERTLRAWRRDKVRREGDATG